MERNSDVVKMTSYAPLFENINKKDWPCNLIHFNSNQTYGRASYYVQQMAAVNRPTYNVFTSETTSSEPAPPFVAGSIGLGSYATQCEYRNIQVTTSDGKTTNYTPQQFVQKRGTWSVANDVIAQTSRQQMTLAQLPDFQSNDYTITLQACKTGGLEGFLIYY